ncbi:GNAT family N-acetyltransferase [Reinekea blandensis]|uniref:Putative acetyltransferase n=1 Tax=Reinekea blandensis MED297 TaxID=314283 RepID=A4BHV4_9GAMM|nr:GNAT family N-acetyltransferase [Reinekea blandensis]EAR08359.1 putative acetyltransferase [Reinekea sp. MED297] [Reinekea blandensis MED297]
MSTLNLQINDTADDDLREQVVKQLRTFNDQTSQWHRDIRAEGGKPLDVFAFDEHSELIGGLVSETYWGWLDIDYLWVAEPHRHTGLGSLLLLEAETRALEERHCRQVKLSTFSFQAPGFYQNLGYRVVGELSGYPPGASMLWLRKELGPAGV